MNELHLPNLPHLLVLTLWLNKLVLLLLNNLVLVLELAHGTVWKKLLLELLPGKGWVAIRANQLQFLLAPSMAVEAFLHQLVSSQRVLIIALSAGPSSNVCRTLIPVYTLESVFVHIFLQPGLLIHHPLHPGLEIPGYPGKVIRLLCEMRTCDKFTNI